MTTGDKVIFVRNDLHENLIGKTGIITKFYGADLVQVTLDDDGRWVLARLSELQICKIGG